MTAGAAEAVTGTVAAVSNKENLPDPKAQRTKVPTALPLEFLSKIGDYVDEPATSRKFFSYNMEADKKWRKRTRRDF